MLVHAGACGSVHAGACGSESGAEAAGPAGATQIPCDVHPVAAVDGRAALRVRTRADACGSWRLALRLGQAPGAAGGGAHGEHQESALSSCVVDVCAGALDASSCLAIGSGIKRATLGRVASFMLRARDGAGNARRVAREVPFRVCLLSAPGTVELSITRNEDGTFLVTYTPFGSAGEYVLAVTYAAKPIAGSPFKVAVGRDHASRPSRTRQRPLTAPAYLQSQQQCRQGAAALAVPRPPLQHAQSRLSHARGPRPTRRVYA